MSAYWALWPEHSGRLVGSFKAVRRVQPPHLIGLCDTSHRDGPTATSMKRLSYYRQDRRAFGLWIPSKDAGHLIAIRQAEERLGGRISATAGRTCIVVFSRL